MTIQSTSMNYDGQSRCIGLNLHNVRTGKDTSPPGQKSVLRGVVRVSKDNKSCMDVTVKKNPPTGTKSSTPRLESQETNSFPLAVFRILFGLVLTRLFWDLYYSSWATNTFQSAKIVMNYGPLSWLPPSQVYLQIILILLLCSSISFCVGFLYRFNCCFLLTTYSYLYLIDASWNTSSSYLVLVLIALFTLTNCHKSGSLDSLLFSRSFESVEVPDLHLIAFKVVFTAASFYAGLGKWLSEDWMERAEPFATWLFFGSISHSYPLWSFLSGPAWGFSPSALLDLSFLLSYSVVSIEIVGSVSLWHRWSRPLGLFAIALLQLFHSSIAQGVYPYIVICSFCLWIDHSISRSALQLVGLTPKVFRPKKLETSRSSATGHPFASLNFSLAQTTRSLIYLLLIAQIVYPIVPYTGTHSPSWSKRAYNGSWRMMLHSQDTLVSWYANKLPNPKTNYMSPGNSYLVSHHSEAYSSRHVSDEIWREILNSPSLLLQWSDRMILNTVRKTGFSPSQLHVNAYRSINARPYQLWFSPAHSDVIKNRCFESSLGCDSFIEPQIQEFNTLDWMFKQQVFIDEWIQKGHEAVVFAQRSGPSFDISFEPFSERISFILMSGKVALDVADRDEAAIQPMIGEQVEISWRTYHSIRTIGKEPAAWAYVWPWPRNMTLGDAMGM